MWTGRLRLLAVFGPLLLVSLFVTAEMVVDGTTFTLGAAFFGRPLLSRIADYVARHIPNWRELIQLRR